MATDDLDTLLTRVAMADRRAFAALYTATSAKLFGLCLRILKDRALAEDTLQEVYVKIWQRAGSYIPGRVRPMTWLITVARNHAIDVLRRNKQALVRGEGNEVEVDRLESSQPGPADALTQKQIRAQIDACLKELPDDRAMAVRFAYLEGASYAELAAHFSVPLNTMRTWLRRSLLNLKACLSR